MDDVERRISLKRGGGRARHEAWVETKETWQGETQEHEPMVLLSNDDDTYYFQVFTSADALKEFIGTLQSALYEAWPSEKYAENDE